MRVIAHPILGPEEPRPLVRIWVDGRPIMAREGETIAAALLAEGIRVFRHAPRHGEPRGVFCAIGRCTDCVVMADGIPNVRACVTPVKEEMHILTVSATKGGERDGSGKRL